MLVWAGLLLLRLLPNAATAVCSATPSLRVHGRPLVGHPIGRRVRAAEAPTLLSWKYMYTLLPSRVISFDKGVALTS